jgi:quercetin dioxygenase-like cupin family protein
VERFTFGADAAFTPHDDRLDHVTIAPLTGRLSTACPVQAAVFRVAPGGRLARHPATVPQILAVVEGAGEVSGSDGVFEPLTAGEAVFWHANEEHETRSDSGLTAVIVEAEGLEPWRG